MMTDVVLQDMEEIYARNYEWDRFEGKSFLISGAYGMLASYMVFFLLYLSEYKNINSEIYLQGRNPKKAGRRFGEYLDKEYVHLICEDILSGQEGNIPCVNYIVHAAGIANPRLYAINPVEVIEPNVSGTYHLLQNCKRYNLEGFLLFSSGDVYGKGSDAGDISEESYGIIDPLDLHSCYGESKRMAETMCSAFYREYGIRTVIARIGHTYGPTMDIENDPRVFACFMKSALYGEDIVIHSDGLAKRPFCYISDAVAGYFLLLLKGKSGEAYNVTNTNQFLSIREVAKIIANIPEPPVNVTWRKRDKLDTYLADSVNHENKPVENKMYNLGWNNPVDVREGFTRVYRHFRLFSGKYPKLRL